MKKNLAVLAAYAWVCSLFGVSWHFALGQWWQVDWWRLALGLYGLGLAVKVTTMFARGRVE